MSPTHQSNSNHASQVNLQSLDSDPLQSNSKQVCQDKKQQSDSADWMIPINVMLGSLNHAEVQACSISSIPDDIRDPKEEAFKPKVVSIGPLHRGTTRHIQLTEETKWRYMREFLNRNGRSEDRLKECGPEILKMDKVIVASYGGNIESKPHELAKVMVVDGCFLLEFLHRLENYMNNNNNCPDDPIFESEAKVLSIVNDITMLENQIPFIVLKKLYRKVYPDGSRREKDHRVADIVRRAFGYPSTDCAGETHVLHVMHLSTVEQDNHGRKAAKQELVRCARRLQAAGITIEAKTTSQPEMVDRINFNISFVRGVLKIPTLYVKDTTEVRWRNLIAWEQSKISLKCKYTSYALFFEGLICCKHDIGLLLKKGVIVNESKKSMDDLLKMFRTLSKGVEHMDSGYTDHCLSLNIYQGSAARTVFQKLPFITWHMLRHLFEIIWYYLGNSFRILKRDHIPTLWKFIGVLAAIALLVLTIMQTYYSARSSK